MKILAICGSPHKGNCYSVLHMIKDSYPTIDLDILMLRDMHLEPCRGCYTCVLRGEQFCPLEDDRDLILQKISQADGIVLASPVYVNHVSALMKQFIDRLGYLGHRPRFHDKYLMPMAIGSGFGADKATSYIGGTFSVFGFNVTAPLELYIAAKTETEQAYTQRRAREVFSTFLSALEEGRGTLPAPTLTQLIYFNIFKAVAELNKDAGKADYEFYRDKTDYLYDTKTSPVKRMLGKRIAAKEVNKMMLNR